MGAELVAWACIGAEIVAAHPAPSMPPHPPAQVVCGKGAGKAFSDVDAPDPGSGAKPWSEAFDEGGLGQVRPCANDGGGARPRVRAFP